MPMRTISIRLDDSLYDRLTQAARRIGITKSTLVRGALDRALANDISQPTPSAYDLASALCSSVEGPGESVLERTALLGLWKVRRATIDSVATPYLGPKQASP